MTIESFQQKNIHCLFDNTEISAFSPAMLSAQYWQAQNAVTGSAQGRGTTWFVQHNNKNSDSVKHWVLRHYYRGGLIGKIIKDSYFFTSQKNSRAAKEFALLAHMQTLALPAPKPIAYRVTRHGLLYRADLLSNRIENAQDLVAILSKQIISDELWTNIGATIKQFHDNNIYHHDLNAHNILVNEQQDVYLIDFDRGEIRASNQASWQQANMARLQRSFLKELKQLPKFHWHMENWRLLIEGYLLKN
ncbi:MAG: 3-deoxy-D-manno-octulosonic acid kinase [Colwellia sp.]|nr:3-deoxy-D-manno-octulosonic acid kinase [Colwellia sp.]